MRMAYTKKDVRELTDFAAEFGVTIVPCIQTLAHLETTLRWRSHWDIVDHGGTMLVEEEKTYELIENIIKSWRDCVDTELIHIGMDEAFYLGRGKYVDLHGCKPKFELMCNHLKRVLKICEKYGFRAMIWSDMFFHLVFGGYYTEDQAIDPKLMELVPEDVTLVYWDYYSTTEEQYRTQMKKHTAFPNQIGFAGGAWKWSGLVLYHRLGRQRGRGFHLHHPADPAALRRGRLHRGGSGSGRFRQTESADRVHAGGIFHSLRAECYAHRE